LPNAGTGTDYGLVTNVGQTFSGRKDFLNTIAIPVPAGNTETCIVLGSAGGGGDVGALSIGDTVTYPNAVEIQRVKGVTSNIQTQLNGKQPTLTAGNGIDITTNTISIIDVSINAYTILANNTNASAVPTNQVFRNEPSKAYAGAITPTASTQAPTGATNHTYSWCQVGDLVTIRLNLDYASAGTGVTSLACMLPSDCPIPELPSGVNTALNVISYGVGTMAATKASVATMGTAALRLKTTAPNTFDIQIQRASGAYATAYATIQYFV